MPPPFPFSSRFPFPFPSSVSFLALFFPFSFLSLVFVPAGPFSPPFEKALVFFLLLVKRLVRLTQGMSECPTIALLFLFLIRIFFLFSLSLQLLDRFLSSKMLAYSPNSSFTLLRSRQNKMYTKIALFSQSLLFLLSFSLSVLALFLSSFSVRLSVDIPGVY